MSAKQNILMALAVAGVTTTGVTANAEVVAHCGASQGTSYFFHDEIFNPEGPDWAEDGIGNGRIILVREAEDWDILFEDVFGSPGYRSDGATVILLAMNAQYITVGAFHPNYVDTYTFNLVANEVVWTSHKTGTFAPKVAIYRADCS